MNKSNDNYEQFMMDFRNYLFSVKNLSTSYIDKICSTIRQFLIFVNSFKFNDQFENVEEFTLNDIRSISRSEITHYLSKIADVGLSPKTRIDKCNHIRAFFKYLFNIRHDIFSQPFNTIFPQKRAKMQIPNYLSLEESKRLLNLYKESHKINEIRNYAIISLGLFNGLRVSEIRNLNISDISFTEDTILIHGKGNKERIGHINETVKEALKIYLEYRRNITPKNKKDEDALFLSNERKRIHTNTIRRFMKVSYRNAEIDEKKYAFHTLRHTCATLLFKAGNDIKIIQKILGHSSVNTTQIYTHIYDKEVEDAIKIHPLGKFMMKDARNFLCTAT